jgi:general nucleoside transport system permease protein
MNWLRTNVLPSVLALVGALVVSAVVIALAGQNPFVALLALADGAFGSLDSLSEVAVKSCPLLLTGLAIAVAFQSGVWNIGAEGQLLVGALAMSVVGSKLPLPAVVAIPLALLLSAIAGAGWAAIAAQLKLRREVSEVISTIMLNFVALFVISYLVQGPLQESGGRYPQTDTLLPQYLLPRLAPYRVHIGIAVALLGAVAMHVFLYRGVAGYEIRAAGLNPEAAKLAGINVRRRMLLAFVISGALAGLAGGIEVSAITRRLYERFSPGWGFTAIAVGLLGRLNPAGVVASAILFGALDAGSNAMQRVAGVSAVIVSIIQATVILFLVALPRLRRSER